MFQGSGGGNIRAILGYSTGIISTRVSRRRDRRLLLGYSLGVCYLPWREPQLALIWPTSPYMTLIKGELRGVV